jgi:1-phosphofructokinase
MNTAIDIFMETQDLKPNIVNRAAAQDVQPNGKGVNVSFVLKMLGVNSIALGFIGGFTGDFIKAELAKKSIKSNFVRIDGLTRLNVFTKVKSKGQEYKLVNRGPQVLSADFDKLLNIIGSLKKNDILCVSGSVPPGAPKKIDVSIMEAAAQKGVQVIFDSESIDVRSIASRKPFLLKPNLDELAKWFGAPRKIDRKGAVLCGKKLLKWGVQNVLISMGSKGAIFLNKEACIYANAPSGEVVNTACSGDTLLAVFLAYILKEKDYSYALKQAVAAGSSTAFRAGLTDFSDVEQLSKQVKVLNLA